jgi:hypothetical protein
MLIDRTHRGWAVFSGLFLLVACLSYAIYAATWPNGPNGRTWPGMMFGIFGTLMMLFAGALSVRKKTVRIRAGSLAWWLRGHIWIGLLSVPMILFHAAFHWGGWLELALWVILAVVVGSGVFGLILQNTLPKAMRTQLPEEAIPDQFAEVCRRLVLVGDEKVIGQCSPPIVEASVARGPNLPDSRRDSALDLLASFHVHTVRPFLSSITARNPRLANTEQAQLLFDQVRSSVPESCHTTIDILEKLCSDRRQLAQQERLFRLLHSWLRIHVPCSIILFILAAIHVAASLYY